MGKTQQHIIRVRFAAKVIALMLWLCVRFPFLPLEVITNSDPEQALARQSFALLQPLAQGTAPKNPTHGHQNDSQTSSVRAGQICICTPSAHTAGVRPGMTLATALSLCGQLDTAQREPQLEQERLISLAEIAYGFTSHVAYSGANQLLLEISASLRLFTDATTLLAKLETVFTELGHTSEFSIAHTPLAAQWLIKANIDLTTHQLVQTSPVSENQPNAAFSNLVRRTLRTLPLRLELWDANITARLLASGLRTIGAVCDLPKAPLGRRLGQSLLLDIARAFGDQPDPRRPIKPSEKFSNNVNFLSDLTQTDGLIFPMHRLLRDLSVWLTTRQLLTQSIQWQLQHERHDTLNISVSVAEPTANPERWLTLTQLQLERLELLPEISALRLHVEALSPVVRDERDLLQKAGSEPLMSPPELLDLFRARLGPGALQQLNIGNNHLPEQQNALTTQSNRKHAVPASSPPDPHSPQPDRHSVFQRPTWLLPEPRQVVPAHFTFVRGPERIDMGWWQQKSSPVSSLLHADRPVLSKGATTPPTPTPTAENSDDSNLSSSHDVDQKASSYAPHIGPELMRNIVNTTRRDYYIALDRNGCLCWLFTQPSSHGTGWYLHGYFS